VDPRPGRARPPAQRRSQTSRTPTRPEGATPRSEPAVQRRFWDERYRSAGADWSGEPNTQLVAETAGLAPGSALDTGSGEGADALWLAGRGWQVTAVDVSRVALDRSAARAAPVGAAVAGRLRWQHQDLLTWSPPASAYDLVTAQLMHLPTAAMNALVRRLATSVAPGGTLLIVGYAPSDEHTAGMTAHYQEIFFTAEQITALLDPQD